MNVGDWHSVGLWSQRIGDVSGLASMADDLPRRGETPVRARRTPAVQQKALLLHNLVSAGHERRAARQNRSARGA
jgi:hypothetical protein